MVHANLRNREPAHRLLNRKDAESLWLGMWPWFMGVTK
jgi:hypothetical protein